MWLGPLTAAGSSAEDSPLCGSGHSSPSANIEGRTKRREGDCSDSCPGDAGGDGGRKPALREGTQRKRSSDVRGRE